MCLCTNLIPYNIMVSSYSKREDDMKDLDSLKRCNRRRSSQAVRAGICPKTV